MLGCETCSLTLKEYTLRVSENRMLRSVSGSKRDEGTEEWRRQCNEEAQN
jgi:hypothetical protein